MRNILGKIQNFFIQGHERTIRAKKNILFSFSLKGISVIVSFLIVPIALRYLNSTKYGIWLTLSSIISWFYIIDIGMGNGLRNKFAEALAKGNKSLAKTYVSTAYAIIGMIIVVFYLLFLIINPFLSWVKILNANPEMSIELNRLVFAVMTFFLLQLFLKLIGTILVADQRPAVNDLINVICSVISLVVIYILSKTTSGSLLYLGITYTVTPVMVYFITTIILYTGRYNEFRPTLKYVDFKYGRELTSLGFKFFIIQISGIIVYSTGNIILTQLLGPEEVVPYNIAYKYFFSVNMFFSIIITPFWSGFTEAYNKNDFEWIHDTMKKLKYIAIGFIGITLLMVIFANLFYRVWVGDKVTVPFILTLFMGLYITILSWGTPFVFFINGVGKIRLQLYIAAMAACINIPLSICLVKYFNLGSAGIIISICLLSFSGAIIYPIQYKKILKNENNSIWNS